MAEPDRITRLEAACLFTGFGDDAGTVTAKDCRQCVGVKDTVAAQLGVDGIDTRCLQPDLDLAGFGYSGFRDLDEFENLRCGSGRCHVDGFHVRVIACVCLSSHTLLLQARRMVMGIQYPAEICER